VTTRRAVIASVLVIAIAGIFWWSRHDSGSGLSQSDLDKLVPVTITYKVHGSAPAVDVTVTSATGTEQRKGLSVPLGEHGSDGVTANIPRGQAVVLLAQNAGSTGDVECIIVDSRGEVISDNHASGASAIASCNGVAS